MGLVWGWFFLGVSCCKGKWVEVGGLEDTECEPLYTVKKQLQSGTGLHLGMNLENAEMTRKSDYFFFYHRN